MDVGVIKSDISCAISSLRNMSQAYNDYLSLRPSVEDDFSCMRKVYQFLTLVLGEGLVSLTLCLMPVPHTDPLLFKTYIESGDASTFPDEFRDRMINMVRMGHIRTSYYDAGFQLTLEAALLSIEMGKYNPDKVPSLKILNSEDVDEVRESVESRLSELILCVDKLVDNHYKERGFVWNGYFGYYNPNHPLFKAYNGDLPLTPENFRLCFDTSQLSSLPIEEDPSLRLRYDCHHVESPPIYGGSGWKAGALKEAIKDYLPANHCLPGFGVPLPLTEEEEGAYDEMRRINDLIAANNDLDVLNPLYEELSEVNDNLHTLCRKMYYATDMETQYYTLLYNQLVLGGEK
jgi:hypothetical protein